MQLKANFKVLTGMQAFLVSKSDINDHVNRLVTVRRLSPNCYLDEHAFFFLAITVYNPSKQ